MTTKFSRGPRAANALMALSMALLSIASLMNLSERPSPVRLVFAGALLVLCATFAYRAWRCRRPGGERA